MNNLFNAIHEDCKPQVWSQGVELSRRDAVTGDSEVEDEIQLRVLDHDKGFSSEVILYPEDEDWNCNCKSGEDPCVHVVASVIALKRARENDEALPQSKTAAGRIIYKMTSSRGFLKFQRVARMPDGEEEELTAPLSSYTSGRVKSAGFSATQIDMQVEIALRYERGSNISSKAIHEVLKLLKDLDCVELDGNPVAVSALPVGLSVVVEPDGNGFKLTGSQDQRITKTYKNLVALCGKSLHPMNLPELNADEHEIVTKGRRYGPKQLTELEGEIIPALERKLKVIRYTPPVVDLARVKPRVEMNLKKIGKKLEVRAGIVYGDPVIAKIANNRLVAVGKDVPIRRQDDERKLKDELRRELDLELMHPYIYEKDLAIEFVEKIKAWRGDIVGDGFQAFCLCETLTPQLVVKGDEVEASFQTTNRFYPSEDKSAQADKDLVLAAWQAGDSYVPLVGGGWAPLPIEWLNQFGPQLSMIFSKDVESNETVKQLKSLELMEVTGQSVTGILAELKEKLANFESVPTATLPKNFNADLRPYQKEGIDWLNFVKSLGMGALLADDMGLGKTLQAISVIKTPTLVVAPISLLSNWESEIHKFRPGLKVSRFHGSKRSIDESADVILTSYALMRRDLEGLNKIAWQLIVLDESQYIKNPDNQTSRAAYQLTAEFKLALSGTPVENRLEDLWSQFQFLNAGLLGDLSTFKKMTSKSFGQNEMIMKRVKPFILRRLKSEVAKDLPPKIENIVSIELDEDERRTYRSIAEAGWGGLKSKMKNEFSHIQLLEVLLRLRQSCCHLGLLPGQSRADSAKLDFLVDKLDELSDAGHKVLVFSQWTMFLDIIEKRLAAQNLPLMRIDGKTQNRAGIVDKFQNTDGSAILLMSIKAGGVGLNLTAADHVFIMDPWWNPTVESQAADRAHRIGQKSSVFVHKLVAKDTVEERIIALQEKKNDLAASILKDGQAAGGLSKEDLMFLMS